MERFSAQPTVSIPSASRGWSETIASYRFLGNEEVDWRKIMAPHYAQTRQRMREYAVVLCLQDTTELDFNGQDMAGLGPVSHEAQRGMYLHPTYAITPQREPLGVTDPGRRKVSAGLKATSASPKWRPRWQALAWFMWRIANRTSLN